MSAQELIPEQILDMGTETPTQNEIPEPEVDTKGMPDEAIESLKPEKAEAEPPAPEPEAEAPDDTPDYEPNYKYNAQGQEFEFDERLRGAITNKDSEDYIRDLVTKAHGLDTYKARVSEKDEALKDLNTRFNEISDTHKKYETGIERLDQLAKSDLSSFQKAWGISDRQILDLAREIVQQDENPQLAQQRQQNFQNVLQGWQTQDQQAQYQNQISNESARLHEMEMELAMTKPDVSEFQTAYDQAKGREGAFRDLVNTYGSAEWNRGNRLAPRDCVKAVMNEFAFAVQRPTNQPPVQPQAGSQAGTASSPSLPNFGSGRTGSPVKKKMSWAELKRQAGI